MLKDRYLPLTVLAFCMVLLLGGVEGKANFPRQVIDDFGEKVIISKKPQRIISLSPANTEILFAIGAGDKVVGVTTYCDFPLEVKEIDKVGGFATPNVEAILAKKPDLVVASYGNREESVKRLRELGITVVAVYPKTLEDVLNDIKLVGEATGYEKEATKLLEKLKKRIDLIRKKGNKIPGEKRPRILYLVWYPELWTAGKGTFANDLIQIAGGKNIASDIQGWKIISKEVVIEKDPQITFCSGMGENSFIIKEKILQDADLQKVSALQSGRVYTISSDIVERPGPRVVDGLEKISYYIQNWWEKEQRG